jgi:hypothetical protein
MADTAALSRTEVQSPPIAEALQAASVGFLVCRFMARAIGPACSSGAQFS